MIKEENLPEEWEILNFEECIEKALSSNKLKIPKKDYGEVGGHPIIDQGADFIAGYTDDSNKVYKGNLPIIIFGDHTRIFKFVDFPFALGADGTKILIPKKDLLNAKYFYFFLKGIRIEDHGYDRHYKYLKEKKIVIPPLKTQQKIVEILEKAEKLKQWRAEADVLTDEYLKSVFLDMFGDPIQNSKSFQTSLLKDLCTFKSGGTPSRKHEEFFEGDIPWITTVALGPRYIDSKDAVEYITADAISKSATKLIPKDSVLIGTRVGVGKASINRCEIGTNQDIISLVNINKKLNKDFLLHLFSLYEGFFESQLRGATIKGITSSTLKNLKIILPPLELQNQFAETVKKIEQLKQHQKQSKQQIDNLFNTLMQKAFKGELTC
jgi:type I restriction enzyme S subunit